MEIKDQRVYLKVKLISLGDEARTIRRMENQGRRRRPTEADVRPELTVVDGKPFGTQKRPRVDYRYRDWRAGLAAHRRFEVRPESRVTHLAYGFLRGRKYHQIEQRADPSTPVRWDRVRQLVARYGVQEYVAQDYGLRPLMTRSEFQAVKAEESKRLEDWIRSAG